MELKHLITHFTYRIEPKPEGGFIAHASDPTLPALEAPTREELQQKIQANISSALAAEFPSLQLPLENKELKFAFHVERKPEGGFVIHSADPNAKAIEGATHEEIESHFAEKLLGFAGKHFMPELTQALAARGNSADIKVFVNRSTTFTGNAGSQNYVGSGRDLSSGGSIQPNGATIEGMESADARSANGNFNVARSSIANSPIVPETSSGSAMFRFVLTFLVIVVLMSFFLHHR